MMKVRHSTLRVLFALSYVLLWTDLVGCGGGGGGGGGDTNSSNDGNNINNDSDEGTISSGSQVNVNVELLSEGQITGINGNYSARTLFIKGAPYPGELNVIQDNIESSHANESGKYAAIISYTDGDSTDNLLAIGSLDSPGTLRTVLRTGFNLASNNGVEKEVIGLSNVFVTEGGNILVRGHVRTPLAPGGSDVALLYSDETVSTFTIVGSGFIWDLRQVSASDNGVVYSNYAPSDVPSAISGFNFWDGVQTVNIVKHRYFHPWQEDGVTDTCVARADVEFANIHLTDGGSLYVNGQFRGPEFLACLDELDSAIFRYKNGILEPVVIAKEEIPGLPGEFFADQVVLLGVIGEDTLVVKSGYFDSQILIVDLDAAVSYSLGHESVGIGNGRIGQVDYAQVNQSGEILLHSRLDSRDQNVAVFNYSSASDVGRSQAEIVGPYYIVGDPINERPDIEGIFSAHDDGVIVVAHNNQWNPIDNSSITSDDESVVLWRIGTDGSVQRVIGEGDQLDVANLESSAEVIFEDPSYIDVHVDVKGNVLLSTRTALIAITKP